MLGPGPRQALTKSGSLPSLAPSTRSSSTSSSSKPGCGYDPLAKRFDVAVDVLGRVTSKQRPGLESILKSMRKPAASVHGVNAEHWNANAERLRNAQVMREEGIDTRPLPSWNFRAGIAPARSASQRRGCSSSKERKFSEVKLDLDEDQKLQDRLRGELEKQELLRRKLQELQAEAEQENLEPAQQEASATDAETPQQQEQQQEQQQQQAPEPEQPEQQLEEIKQQIEDQQRKQEEVRKQLEALRNSKSLKPHELLLENQLEEQRQLGQQLRSKLQRLQQDLPIEEQQRQLVAENAELEQRLAQQMSHLSWQEQVLQELKKQGTRHLPSSR